MIKAIFFDAAGTLFHLRGSVGQHYASVARQMDAEFSPDALDRAFARAWKEAPRRPAIDRERDDDDKQWWRDLVGAVLAQIPSIAAAFDHARFFELAYAHFAEPDVWRLYPDVLDVLELLAPKFQLAVISNFDRRLYTILRLLGIARFFRHVYISSELGADKPDPEIYRRVLIRSGLTAADTLHVGDDPHRDWKAATEAGIRVFKLDRVKNSLGDVVRYLESIQREPIR